MNIPGIGPVLLPIVLCLPCFLALLAGAGGAALALFILAYRRCRASFGDSGSAACSEAEQMRHASALAPVLLGARDSSNM